MVGLLLGPWPLVARRVIASEPHPLQDTERYPLEQALLLPNVNLTGRSVITRNTIRADRLTPPSLWRAEAQHGGKLLEHWIAYTGDDGAPRRVDFVVNQQLWGLFTYLERYQFIRRFGTAAQQYGYNSRIFTRQGLLLGAYLCSGPDAPLEPSSAENSCKIELDAVGLQPIRGPLGL